MHSSNRFPALTADETADIAVNGILANKFMIVVPKIAGILIGLFQCLPIKVKHLVRDYILLERQSRNFKMPERRA